MYVENKRDGEPQHPSLLGFISFLAAKDHAEEYDWDYRGRCPCGQYAKSIGLFDQWMQTDLHIGGPGGIWSELNHIAKLASTTSNYGKRTGTFGQLLAAAILTQVSGR